MRTTFVGQDPNKRLTRALPSYQRSQAEHQQDDGRRFWNHAALAAACLHLAEIGRPQIILIIADGKFRIVVLERAGRLPHLLSPKNIVRGIDDGVLVIVALYAGWRFRDNELDQAARVLKLVIEAYRPSGSAQTGDSRLGGKEITRASRSLRGLVSTELSLDFSGARRAAVDP